MKDYTYSPELDVLKEIKDVEVFIDAGARLREAGDMTLVPDIRDYLEIHPNAQYHLFEPHQEYYAVLVAAVGDKENVFINNFGLGDEEGEFGYNDGLQSIENSLIGNKDGTRRVRVRCLDDYAKEHKLTKTDFLKSDTEAYDHKVLLGGTEILKNTRFIQIEHWNNIPYYQELLPEFEIMDQGYRNFLAVHKTLVDDAERERLRNYILDHKYAELK